MRKTFREKYSFSERLAEATNVLNKYPMRIPIIIEPRSDLLIDKEKYLVPKDLTLGQFLVVIRKRMKLRPEEALFCFLDRVIPNISAMLGDLYSEHRSMDKFLYLTLSKEETFG